MRAVFAAGFLANEVQVRAQRRIAGRELLGATIRGDGSTELACFEFGVAVVKPRARCRAAIRDRAVKMRGGFGELALLVSLIARRKFRLRIGSARNECSEQQSE